MRIPKTTFLLTALTLLLMALGQHFGGSQGMTMALIVAVLMNGTAYFFSDKIALASSGARPIDRAQSPRLFELMDRLVARANLPMPKLDLIPQQAPNAFATGRNPSHASVAVTQGLLDLMNDDELEGVIAHELSHVSNYDILISSIAATIAGAVTWIARMGFWFGGRANDRNRGGGIGGILMLILAPLAAILLKLGISRQREYQADVSGVRMIGHANGLISALEKLGTYNKQIPMNISSSTAALCIVAPLTARQLFSSLFSTHPPLSDRIAVLRNMEITR